MVNSRAKGSSFELSIGKLIYEHLGVTVRRDLEQYRESNHGDLIGLDGWTIECKRYADNSAFLHRPEWWTQTTNAAGDNTHPVLIYKFDRRPVRCVFPIHVINGDWTRKNNEVVTTSFETWCYVVREAQALEIETK